jgi:hypothetical protein
MVRNNKNRRQRSEAKRKKRIHRITVARRQSDWRKQHGNRPDGRKTKVSMTTAGATSYIHTMMG